MAAKASRSAELTRKLFEAVSSCISIVLLILPEILTVVVIKVPVESVSWSEVVVKRQKNEELSPSSSLKVSKSLRRGEFEVCFSNVRNFCRIRGKCFEEAEGWSSYVVKWELCACCSFCVHGRWSLFEIICINSILLPLFSTGPCMEEHRRRISLLCRFCGDTLDQLKYNTMTLL